MSKEKVVQSETVVLVIDMQNRFLSKLRHGEEKRIVPNQLLVLKECSRRNTPVILIEYDTGKRTISAIQNALEGVPVYTIRKEWDDAFTNPDLKKLLKKIGAKKLVLMGINADYCVMSTARSALLNGYQIITSNDVISGMSHHSSDNSSWWYQENGLWIHDAPSLALNIA